MSMGLIGLLGILQTTSPMPADTSNPDSIGFLRDSVVIPYVMEEGKWDAHLVDLPFLYNGSDVGQIVHLSSICKTYVLEYSKGKFVSATLCQDIIYNRKAFLLTIGNFRNSKNLIGRVMLDWERDNTIDFCSEIESVGGRIIETPIPKDQCQPYYFTLLEALKEEYDRINTQQPNLIGDLD